MHVLGEYAIIIIIMINVKNNVCGKLRKFSERTTCK